MGFFQFAELVWSLWCITPFYLLHKGKFTLDWSAVYVAQKPRAITQGLCRGCSPPLNYNAVVA